MTTSTPFTQFTQFTVPVGNTPGRIGYITKKLGSDKITLIGITAEVIGDTSFIRFVTPANVAQNVPPIIKDMGLTLFQRPVLGVTIPNKPGELGRFGTYLSKKGVNLNGIYGSAPANATETLLFLALDVQGDKLPVDVLKDYFESVTVSA
jgi:hypothetical protein